MSISHGSTFSETSHLASLPILRAEHTKVVPVNMRWNLLSNPNAEAGPSKRGQTGGGREAEVVVPTDNRYETILKDEERYQEMQYTTTEEVPSCMTLL